MLVDANRLFLTTDDDDPLERSLNAVRAWLSIKCRVPIEDLVFSDEASYAFAESRRVEAWSTSTDFAKHPQVNAIRFSHPDASVRGRLWVTEIGMRQLEPGGHVEASILLQGFRGHHTELLI